MDKVLCKCDNKECALELTLFPYGLGDCPKCGKGRMRPEIPVHPLAYAPIPQNRLFSESHISKLFEEGMKQIEERLQAEAEMDRYESTEG